MNAHARPTKPFAWSFSRLKNFENCPRKMNEVDLKKAWKEGESEALTWGDEVHKAWAARLGPKRVPLPPTLRRYEEYAAVAEKYAVNGTMKTELSLAMDRNFQACGYFDQAAWFRCKVDLLIRVGNLGIAWDWKTGKVLHDSVQLGLNAAAVFANFPEVTQCVTSYIWLGNDATSNDTWTPESMPGLWNAVLPRVRAFERAYLSGDFDPLPSGLCKRYCPVESCEYHGIGG